MTDKSRKLLQDVEDAARCGDMTLKEALEAAIVIGFKEASDKAYTHFSEKYAGGNVEQFEDDYIRAMIAED